MQYKKDKEPKKPAPVGKLFIMLFLILLSLSIVAVIYLIKGGIIKPPEIFEKFLGMETSSAGQTQASDDQTSSKKPAKPQKPPELVVNDGGSYDSAKLDELRAILKSNEFSTSVYYFDLTNGKELRFNEGKQYFAGSVTKAPYCKWIIASGQDLTKEIALEEKSIAEGGGALKENPIGTLFTVEKLIEEAITKSDNTAYNMLVQEFGFEGFSSYSKELGVSSSQSKSNIFGNMSAIGAGVYFADIYSFSVSEPEKAETLIANMKNTTYRRLISEALPNKEVAHKFGYNNGNAGFHDAAIVYDENPYILTIFTTLNPDTKGVVEYIQSIAKCIDSMR